MVDQPESTSICNNNESAVNEAVNYSLLNSQHKHSPAVSPHILRRTLYKLDKQQKEKNKRLLLWDERKSSGSGDWNSAGGSTSSSVESPLFSTRFGFMEGKISRFQLKRLKIKQQALLEHGVWKPMENGVWRATNGNEIRLTGRRIGFFSNLERQVLEKIIISRLQKLGLGCPVIRPKESLPLRQRRLKYNRRKAQTVNIIDKKKLSDSRSPIMSGQQVFGVPLSQCVQYEQAAYDPIKRRNEAHKISADQVLYPSTSISNVAGLSQGIRDSLIFKYDNPRVAPSCSSTPACSRLPSTSMSTLCKYPVQKLSDSQLLLESPTIYNRDVDSTYYRNPIKKSSNEVAQFSDQVAKLSLSDQTSVESSPSYAAAKQCSSSRSSVYTSQDDSPFVDRNVRLSNDSLFGGSPSSKSDSSLFNAEPEIKRVPRIVQTCTDYLKDHGLQTIGLFRIAGSAKRCRQLKLELDSGQEVVFVDEETDVYPHDVATLLKEYFRDLPDPLFTKELYPCFVAAAKLPEDSFQEALQYLVFLLPTANCDTLLVLLQFLHQVSNHSDDFVTETGVKISGNKMNVRNLATVFGPTMLRPGSINPSKISQNLSDNDNIIKVVEAMIDNCDKLFIVPNSLQDALYRNIQETDPDALDTILTQLWNNQCCQPEDANRLKAAVYISTEEKVSPDVITREADGSTVVTTRQHTTHRIVYSMHGAGPTDDDFNAVFGPTFTPKHGHSSKSAEDIDDSTSGKGSSIVSSEPSTSTIMPSNYGAFLRHDRPTTAAETSTRYLRVLSSGSASQNISSSSSESHLNGPLSYENESAKCRNSSLASGSSEEVLNLTSYNRLTLDVDSGLGAPQSATRPSPNPQRKHAVPRKITPIAKLTEVMRFGSKKS